MRDARSGKPPNRGSLSALSASGGEGGVIPRSRSRTRICRPPPVSWRAFRCPVAPGDFAYESARCADKPGDRLAALDRGGGPQTMFQVMGVAERRAPAPPGPDMTAFDCHDSVSPSPVTLTVTIPSPPPPSPPARRRCAASQCDRRRRRCAACRTTRPAERPSGPAGPPVQGS